MLRARESSSDMKASIDLLTEKLLRQVKHYRDKRSRRNGRSNGMPPEGGIDVTNLDPQIVKTKQFVMEPMRRRRPSSSSSSSATTSSSSRTPTRTASTSCTGVGTRGYGLIEPQL